MFCVTFSGAILCNDATLEIARKLDFANVTPDAAKNSLVTKWPVLYPIV